MERHIQRRHTDSRNFHCDICPKSFKTNSELKVHQSAIHNIGVDKDKPVIKIVKPIKPVESRCKKCDLSTFRDENEFNYHVLVCYGKTLLENNEIEYR